MKGVGRLACNTASRSGLRSPSGSMPTGPLVRCLGVASTIAKSDTVKPSTAPVRLVGPEDPAALMTRQRSVLRWRHDRAVGLGLLFGAPFLDRLAHLLGQMLAGGLVYHGTPSTGEPGRLRALTLRPFPPRLLVRTHMRPSLKLLVGTSPSTVCGIPATTWSMNRIGVSRSAQALPGRAQTRPIEARHDPTHRGSRLSVTRTGAHPRRVHGRRALSDCADDSAA